MSCDFMITWPYCIRNKCNVCWKPETLHFTQARFGICTVVDNAYSIIPEKYSTVPLLYCTVQYSTVQYSVLYSTLLYCTWACTCTCCGQCIHYTLQYSLAFTCSMYNCICALYCKLRQYYCCTVHSDVTIVHYCKMYGEIRIRWSINGMPWNRLCSWAIVSIGQHEESNCNY